MLQNLSMFSGAQIEPRDWEGAENHSFAAPVSPLKFQSGARGGVFCSLLLRGGQFFLKTFNQGDLSHGSAMPDTVQPLSMQFPSADTLLTSMASQMEHCQPRSFKVFAF